MPRKPDPTIPETDRTPAGLNRRWRHRQVKRGMKELRIYLSPATWNMLRSALLPGETYAAAITRILATQMKD